jgi:hypothetical protein
LDKFYSFYCIWKNENSSSLCFFPVIIEIYMWERPSLCIDLLLGMGSSSLILTLRNGGEFDLNPQNSDVTYLTNNMFLAFIFIMFTLILIITLVPLFKFRYTKQMGVVLILNYVAFTVLSFLSEFGILFENKLIWFDH